MCPSRSYNHFFCCANHHLFALDNRCIITCTAATTQGGNANTDVERGLIEEVHDAISDLVELIKTYQHKNKLAQVLTSTLFKRRQNELDAVVERAISRLQVSDVKKTQKYGGLTRVLCTNES